MAQIQDSSLTHDSVRLTAWVLGSVQGVGFRWWTRQQALELDLIGSVTNLPDGRVCVVAEGPRIKVEELLARLGPTDPPSDRPGSVRLVIPQWHQARGGSGFEIR